MSDYSTLKQDVERLSSREVDDALFATLVRQVEYQINRRLRTQDQVVRQMLEEGTVAGQYIYSWPSDALSVVNLETERNNRRHPLMLMSMEALDDRYGALPGGSPEAYAIVGRDLEIRPCPNVDGQPLRMSYHQAIPAISPEKPTNWLLTLYADVYLYGVLQFLSIYVRDTQATQLWSELYGNAMNELQQTSDEAEWSGATPAMVAQ